MKTIIMILIVAALYSGCASKGGTYYDSAYRKPCHFTEVEVHHAHGITCMTPRDMRHRL